MRELFSEAEEELALCKMTSDDETAFLKSSLHVIVIDEIDAVFRKRSETEDSGSITRDSVVNQLLSKLDGVNALNNILLIGMTNRKELLDDALLRPGRLEVQIEVPLPDESGRREILQVKMKFEGCAPQIFQHYSYNRNLHHLLDTLRRTSTKGPAKFSTLLCDRWY